MMVEGDDILVPLKYDEIVSIIKSLKKEDTASNVFINFPMVKSKLDLAEKLERLVDIE